MGWLADETGLDKCAANHVPMTPLSHLRRATDVFPDRIALIDRSRRFTYTQLHERVSRLASALTQLGVKPGDVVATLLPNIAAQVEATWAVPACGAVLSTINTRLEAENVTYIFGHSGAKVVLVDSALLPLVEAAVSRMDAKDVPLIVEAPDHEAGFQPSGRHPDYEDLLAKGDPGFEWVLPQDEWESLALNYTSGTTGLPKGVVYHHRGAYLMTMGTVIAWRMVLHPKLLLIVPLFHCNGWCHTWMLPVLGGTAVCCRDVTARNIYHAISADGVTHFGGAPIVLNAIVNAKEEDRAPFDHIVEVFTAGAPPPAATLAKIEPLGFNVTQVYGLTETYGHITETTWKAEKWDDLPQAERAEIKARTGVALPTVEEATVLDDQMAPVPRDGATAGEIMIRGNTVMKGYYKNPEATAESFAGGYFHTGDVAFRHPDGYIKITDRAKDIIISGGENVSSVEVEGALMHHPAVELCAVVAKPDEKWGEVPCAFVELREGMTVTEAELIAFAREHLAGFKTPKRVVFAELPKTSTGKIQKFELRTVAKTLDD
ncbi:long-chain-fatty-acid--CoA ligase [Actibacterium sp. XHP0104]|uniref:long-chain-fatty-acid--CoA ligase n=1 Tax=Actibacterium sp. XHP0104 TaxID=2984335 RepID=UPI0021E7147E|nr:long-chain-fatty-acid--CoA ligase [Actibacterium sp. XHP0104]MCV2882904.1 long-chain-fatty-acid--CoA ligase [Actibacterium sp. XHP0104]